MYLTIHAIVTSSLGYAGLTPQSLETPCYFCSWPDPESFADASCSVGIAMVHRLAYTPAFRLDIVISVHVICGYRRRGTVIQTVCVPDRAVQLYFLLTETGRLSLEILSPTYRCACGAASLLAIQMD